MELHLDGFEPAVVERVIHRLPKEVLIARYTPGSTSLEAHSDLMEEAEIKDLVIRYCIDERLRLELNRETISERRLIYAYALTGLLPEDVDG